MKKYLIFTLLGMWSPIVFSQDPRTCSESLFPDPPCTQEILLSANNYAVDTLNLDIMPLATMINFNVSDGADVIVFIQGEPPYKRVEMKAFYDKYTCIVSGFERR